MARAKTATDPKAEFERLLDALIQLLLNAKGHLTIGRGVGKMLTDEPEISRASPNFWALSIYAHFDAAQLLAFKLFDDQARAVSIRHLLLLAAQNPGIFPHVTEPQLSSILQIASNQLAMLKKPLKAINAKRNRIIAHLEHTAVHDPAKAEASTRVTLSDLSEVFAFAESILNELSGAFRATGASFELVGITDYELIGSWMIRGKCAFLKEYEAEFGPWTGPRPRKCP